MTNVAPCLSRKPNSRSMIAAPLAASRLPVGSSASQKPGPRRRGVARQKPPAVARPRKLAGVVPGPGTASPTASKFRPCPRKSPGDTGNLQRHRDVYQRRQRRNQVEALENHAHIPPAEARQRVLIHPGQVLTQGADPTARGAFQPGHQHEERRFARPRRPDQSKAFACLHVQRDAAQNLYRPGIALEGQPRRASNPEP